LKEYVMKVCIHTYNIQLSLPVLLML